MSYDDYDEDDDILEVSELVQEYEDDLNYLNKVNDKDGYIESDEEQLEKLDDK